MQVIGNEIEDSIQNSGNTLGFQKDVSNATLSNTTEEEGWLKKIVRFGAQ